MEMAKRDDNPKQLMDLPMDTLIDILVRLPAKSIGCIRCVSNTLLQMMMNHTSFSALHTRRLLVSTNCNSATADAPRFMFCFQYKEFLHPQVRVSLQSVEYNHNTNTLAKGRYEITTPPSTDMYCDCFSFYNLFLLGFRGGDCMLINVLRASEVLRIPAGRIRPSGVHISFGMGYDTETNTIKIVRVRYEESPDSDSDDEEWPYRVAPPYKCLETHVLVLGTENSWREIASVPPSCVLVHMNKVCANGGDMHWLKSEILDGGTREIMSFDFKNEEFYCTPTPPMLLTSDSSTTLHLFTLRGSLAIAQTSSSGRFSCDIQIWVLKEKEKPWMCHYSIKNKTIGSFDHHRGILGDGQVDGFHDSFREWEHGICFTKYVIFKTTTVFFLDLRDGSVNRLVYSRRNGQNYLGLISYHESLIISLRNYGNLDDFED